VETIPWRFTEKAEIAPSGQTLVPVLVNGDRWIAGSWTIASYLEDTFPDSPLLFGGASGRDLTRYYSSLADSLGAAIFPFVAFDILLRRMIRSGCGGVFSSFAGRLGPRSGSLRCLVRYRPWANIDEVSDVP